MDCCVHTPSFDQNIIYDGIIDPEEYQWINQPVNYDITKPFCLPCLDQFIKNGIIIKIIHDIIDDETEEIKQLIEQHPDLFELSFL